MKIRSFETRVFFAILSGAVAVAAGALFGATLLLREIVAGSGTAGPWDAVAESGQALIGAVEQLTVTDPEMASAMQRHRDALSESLRLSRLYALVAGRFLDILPVAALATGVLITGLALLLAKGLARSLSRPIEELIGWTERIARSEPLPSAASSGAGGSISEFEALQRALRSMAGELESARRREIEATRLRAWTEMARRVAHELKNPLTPMRLAAAAIQRKGDAGVQEPAAVLSAEIERLDEMARSFAQFGRMPEGPFSQIDLAELLGSLARRHAAEGTRIAVHAAGDLPTVSGQYEALSRAFQNLLLNAIDASGAAPADVEVHVRAVPPNGALDQPSEPLVEVRVADRGPGIPHETMDLIWEPGFTTKSRGSGLGLAISQRIVTEHGGSLRAATNAAGGTIMTLTLPVATEEPCPS